MRPWRFLVGGVGHGVSRLVTKMQSAKNAMMTIAISGIAARSPAAAIGIDNPAAKPAVHPKIHRINP